MEFIKTRPYIAPLPPYELFTGKNKDKTKRLRCLLEGLGAGDIIYGVVTKAGLLDKPLLIKPLCTAEPQVRYLENDSIKAMVPSAFLKPAIDEKGNRKNYNAHDIVCCEIIDVSLDADCIILTMESCCSKNINVKFGLVNAEDLPAYYRSTSNHVLDKYEDCLIKSKEFLNPNYDVLFELVGLDPNDNFTLMESLKEALQANYTKEVWHAKASELAFRSVAEGIEHFKVGRHIEAFQCLNAALSIDPSNVEGLVARGALYANKGTLLKAMADFEKALSINSNHVEARKYIGETLVALGRNYKDDNCSEDALQSCMDHGNHEQVPLSFETLQQRSGSQYFENFLNISDTGHIDLTMGTKKKHTTSQSSESSSSGSSSCEESIDTNDSEKLYNRPKKDLSLSPLSKRIAAQASTTLPTPKNQCIQPIYTANQSSFDKPTTSSNLKNPNDYRLGNDDTESRLRKLLQDAFKYKEENKKSKKEKSKKLKRESLKEQTVATTLIKNPDKLDFKDAFQAIVTLQHKLSENIQLYEQTIAQIKKPQELIQQSMPTTDCLMNNSAPSDSPPPVAPPPPSISKNSSKRRSPNRSNVSKSRVDSHSRHRSRSPRRRSRRSRSRSISRRRHRSDSRSSRSRRRRTPSPFVPRGTPSPRRRRQLDSSHKHSAPTRSDHRLHGTADDGSTHINEAQTKTTVKSKNKQGIDRLKNVEKATTENDYVIILSDPDSPPPVAPPPPSISQSSSKRHSPNRSNVSKSRVDRHSRHRSRSPRRRRRRSRSRSISRRSHRSGSRSRSSRSRCPRRRTPSPFVPRATPSPRRRRQLDSSRKHSPPTRSGVEAKSDRTLHGKMDEISTDNESTQITPMKTNAILFESHIEKRIDKLKAYLCKVAANKMKAKDATKIMRDPDRLPPAAPLPPAIKGSFSSSNFIESIPADLPNKDETPRYSFPITRPVKVDIAGLLCLATPPNEDNKISPTKSCSISLNSSKRYSPNCSNSSKSHVDRHSRDRSQSPRRRSSKSRSRSISRHRSRSGHSRSPKRML